MLSSYGVSGSWMYFGLPIGGIGLVVLLLRLGLLIGAQTPPISQRLHDLDRSSRPSD
jgi:hypothetical protein